MQATYHTRITIWFAEHTPTHPARPASKNRSLTTCPLRPLLGQLHRLAALVLMTLMTMSLLVWVTMRIIYPQTAPHVDELTGYEVLLPGETNNPANFGFIMLRDIFPTNLMVENPTERLQTTFYGNAEYISSLIIVTVSNQTKKIIQFYINSNCLRLHDLLLRWGRPDYTQKDNPEHHWDLEWIKQNYTISATSHALGLDDAVMEVTIERD